MDQEKGKNGENRGKPGLALFFIMLTMGLTLLVMLMFGGMTEYRMSFSDFDRLLDNTEYLEFGTNIPDSSSNKIVFRNASYNNRWDEVSNLHNVEISDRKIRGKVELRTAKSKLPSIRSYCLSDNRISRRNLG